MLLTMFQANGFIEVFEITDGGIIKYTKGGNAFSKTLTGNKM